MLKKNLFTTFEIASMCKVAHSTVINWENTGKITAYTTPGGHRRIKLEDLLSFLKKYNMPVPEELSNERKSRLLIVDDDHLTVKILVERIKKTGLVDEIETAGDGFEAGKKIVSFLPDVVFLDLFLPGVDGFEVCRNIKGDEALKNIKVVAVTGHDSPENKRRILKNGADCYLVKPVEKKTIVECLTKLLEA